MPPRVLATRFACATSEQAQTIARIAHTADLSCSANEDFAHVARVAAAVGPEARPVAWLHDAVELPWPRIEDLRAVGCSPVEIDALGLLQRDQNQQSDSAYLAHIAGIARAPGLAGRLARRVKAADLADRITHPRRRASGWVPPYVQGLDLLESGFAESANALRARAGGHRT